MKLSIANLFCAAFLIVSGEHSVIGFPPEPKPVSTTQPSTVAPNITTPVTTTTTSTTTTPTSTPPITTPASTTTTPKPTPPPIPQPGEWVVNGTNNTCIIVRMSAQFNLTYIDSNNKSESKNIVVPSNNSSTFVTGVCGDNEQVINIAWGLNTTRNDSLKLHFVKNETKAYSLHHIELYLGPGELPNITNNTAMLIHNMSEYKTGLGNSYRCVKLQRILLTSNMKNLTGVLEVTDLQFQAFRTEKTKIFGLAEDCAVETQDLVPIAVGCALIILVVIVLVAYLIGRRRRQAGGYLSM
ncbi:hypothetical protein PV327_005074 [Microctonus hyperodae]|uniref:Lysosome-associated membrane glycoprotein 5 n=1 Tax=Microctonus hyperodae TaxID=165561 RepID=A0AA39G0M1_MICHY|nr:hypothetical protein PV327_005074 [Microctonus hyperodae]